jgi:tetratricopeptide (TPR) repeat protein
MSARALFLVLLAAATITIVSAPAPAQAQTEESLRRAEVAYNKGVAAFGAQRYDEAATLFEDAYAARAFPEFLYNLGAAYYMKGRTTSDIEAYKKCVDYYTRYLRELPDADDKASIQSIIAVLEKEIERLAANPTEVTPSAEVEKLGDADVRGLVVIETDPGNANIYIDSKKKGPIGKTPWSGSITGSHTIMVERLGYKPMEKLIAPDPSKLLVIYFGMSEDDYLAWLEIKSNIPGSDIYFDDKSVGAAGKTPFSGNVKPGKKKVWVTAEGYDEHYEELDIVQGKTYEVNATLEGTPVGWVSFRGPGIENTKIYLDGKVLCERGPCRKAVPEGQHTVAVARSDYKTYRRKIDVQARTEITVRAQLAEKPGRGDAITTYIFSALFFGGGIYAGLQYRKLDDDITAIEDMGGMPDSDDVDKRKYYGIGALVGLGLGVATGITAVYYTFRDKGAPSTGQIDIRAVALTPEVGPGYAGLSLSAAF